MILSVAAFLTALGFFGWIAGTVFEYQGIAFIGATIVLGVGAMMMVDGLETKTGQVETNVSANQTEIEHTYTPVDTLSTFPLGALVTLFGGVTGMRSLAMLSEGD